MSIDYIHIPVLLSEVLEYASPKPDDIVIDCTFGRGGYSKAFLDLGCKVTAFDRDPEAEKQAKIFKGKYQDNFEFIPSKFSELEKYISEKSADIILFDIGVSSPQLQEAQRGFSFLHDGPLDMRMGLSETTAADLVNNLDEKKLADIFFYYGEERASRKYARLICERRVSKPFETTLDLANFIKDNAASRPKGRKKIHPATLIFQALRIAVNDELEEFKIALEACPKILKSGGRLIMVTFHSLEDRIAKQFSKKHSFVPKTSKYAKEKPENIFTNLTGKPVVASDLEMKENPKASSAKLRALVRTGARYIPNPW